MVLNNRYQWAMMLLCENLMGNLDPRTVLTVLQRNRLGLVADGERLIVRGHSNRLSDPIRECIRQYKHYYLWCCQVCEHYHDRDGPWVWQHIEPALRDLLESAY